MKKVIIEEEENVQEPQSRVPDVKSDLRRRPYGLLEGVGIATYGMSPREAWAAWNAYRKEDRSRRKEGRRKNGKPRKQKAAPAPLRPVLEPKRSQAALPKAVSALPVPVVSGRKTELAAPMKREVQPVGRKNTVVIPELNRRDIETANGNSMFNRGDNSARDYQSYVNRVLSWDIADSKKQQIIDQIHKRWTRQLSLEAQHVPISVAGPARYNPKKYDKSEQILRGAHDFVTWFEKIEESVKESKRQYEDTSAADAKRAEEHFRYYLERGLITSPTMIANALTPIAQYDPARFVELYDEMDRKYRFRKNTTAAKIYDRIKAGTYQGAPKAQKLLETDNLNAYRKRIDAGERVFMKFTTRPKPQLVYALKRRGWHWNALEGAWSVPVDKYDEEFVSFIDDRYAKYL